MNAHHTSYTANANHMNLIQFLSNGSRLSVQLVQICIIRKSRTPGWRPKAYQIDIIGRFFSD